MRLLARIAQVAQESTRVQEAMLGAWVDPAARWSGHR